MKIGIVSLYGWLKLWDNYGTLLQNYALQTHLRRRGHDTYWIRTRVPHRPTARSLGPLQAVRAGVSLALRPFRGPSRGERLQAFNRGNPRYFDDFLRAQVPVSAQEYSSAELLEDPPVADAYISGSDQVWRDVTDVNFLGFGPSRIRRIAYAVSAPWSALSADWYAHAATHVSRFTSIGVRELEGIAACRRLGRPDAVQVIDPTLLLNREDYRTLVSEMGPADSFLTGSLLGYFVNASRADDFPLLLSERLARLQGVPLRAIPLQGSELFIPQSLVFAPRPSGWIDAFDRASAVVTNSYHGALFAVLMQRPFLVFLQGGATTAENSRFFSALAPLGLEDRIVAREAWESAVPEAMLDRLLAPVDWTGVAERLDEMREVSAGFLSAALHG